MGSRLASRPTAQTTGYSALVDKVIPGLYDYRHTLDTFTIDADYTAVKTDQLGVIDASGGAIEITLPAASDSECARLFYYVADATSEITITPDGSDLIGGAASWSLSEVGQVIALRCDGTGWIFESTGLAQIKVGRRLVDTSGAMLVTDEIVLIDATLGAVTFTLLPAADMDGRVVLVKVTSVAGGSVTLDGDASETIDGSTTKVLSAQYDARRLYSDGTAWHLI